MSDELKTMDLFHSTTDNWGSRWAIRQFHSDLCEMDILMKNILTDFIKNDRISEEFKSQMAIVATSIQETQNINLEEYKFIFDILGVRDPITLHLVSLIKFFTNKLPHLAYNEVNKRNPDYDKILNVLEDYYENSGGHDVRGCHRKVFYVGEYVVKFEEHSIGGQQNKEISLWVNHPHERLCPIEYIDVPNQVIVMRRGKEVDDLFDVKKYYNWDFENGLNYGGNIYIGELGDKSNWAWFDGVPLIIDYGANNQN